MEKKEIEKLLLEAIQSSENLNDREVAVRTYAMFIDAQRNQPFVFKGVEGMPDNSITMFLKVDDEHAVYSTIELDPDSVSRSIGSAADKLFEACSNHIESLT